MTQLDPKELAGHLWDARTRGAPIAPPTQTYPDFSLEQAYRVSRLNYERRVAQGASPRGRKIGLTSRAVQKQLGVLEPDYGYLTQDMEIQSGGTLAPRSLIQGRVEGEVAFLLGRDLEGHEVTIDDVRAATECVYPCIEIIDSRVKDWKIKIQDTVADNASSAFFVLGEPAEISALDLRIAGMALRLNGEVLSTGMGAACLDRPENAMAWLARKMTELGDPLRKGDLVLSGAYGPVVPFAPGDRCAVEISGLGKVECVYGK